MEDKIMLRKRFIIETVLDTLKSEMGLEHSRHRPPVNAMVHILSCLVAYAFRPGKPSISLIDPARVLLAQAAYRNARCWKMLRTRLGNFESLRMWLMTLRLSSGRLRAGGLLLTPCLRSPLIPSSGLSREADQGSGL
jgi:hypothetical protein